MSYSDRTPHYMIHEAFRLLGGDGDVVENSAVFGTS